MAYDEPTQKRYNATEKGKLRKRKWAANMTPEQREKQRESKREHMRRKRAQGQEPKESSEGGKAKNHNRGSHE